MRPFTALLIASLCASPAPAQSINAAGEPAEARRANPYERLANELSDKIVGKISNTLVAVLPFEYLDGRQSAGGRDVAESIATNLEILGRVPVADSTEVKKAMKGPRSSVPGAGDGELARKLGAELGVGAVISGSLVNIGEDQVVVSARIIDAETTELLGGARVSVPKTWSDTPAAPRRRSTGMLPLAGPQQSR